MSVLIKLFLVIIILILSMNLPLSTISHYNDHQNTQIKIFFGRDDLNENCCPGSETLFNVERIGFIYIASTYDYAEERGT